MRASPLESPMPAPWVHCSARARNRGYAPPLSLSARWTGWDGGVKRLRQDSRLLVSLALLAMGSPLAAQTITDPTNAPPARRRRRKRSQGPPRQFTFTAAYTADLLADVSGGRRRGRGLCGPAQALGGLRRRHAGHDGLTGLVSVIHLNGSDFTPNRVGGIQAVSAAEASARSAAPL